MRRNPAALAEREYDVVVLGGGVFGICVAWDAALRGLSVALIERGDFSGATSANSFRMIHGGIRYLQHGDFHRVRESSRERTSLLRVAPHLAHPLPIVIPTYGHGLQGRSVLRAAFLAYDLATIDRNVGIEDPGRTIPRCRIISRRECLAMFPGLEARRLTGAGIFHDGQMYSPPRLALAYLRSAADKGCEVANYVEATGFLTRGGRVTGVVARDTLSDEALEIRARVVINAAGPWAERLLLDHLGHKLDPSPVFSRDACMVVRRRLLGDHALAVQGWTKDPDAVLSRGKRHLFIAPWRQCSLVGVWHVVHEGHPDRFTVTEEELERFIAEINSSYPSLMLTRDDVSMWNAGLVLFGENNRGAVNLSYGKRSRIIDHARSHNLDGLITVIGVRWTTARGVAEKVVDLAYRKMGSRPAKCRTAWTPLYGGRFDNFAHLLKQALEDRPPSLEHDVIEALVHNHGTEYRRMLAYMKQDPRLGETVGPSHVLKAEVVNAVRNEMARTLGDVVLRRTGLATAGNPGDEAIGESMAIMATELGWNESRRNRELDQLRAAFPENTVRA